jgi:hypothetical protein
VVREPGICICIISWDMGQYIILFSSQGRAATASPALRAERPLLDDLSKLVHVVMVIYMQNSDATNSQRSTMLCTQQSLTDQPFPTATTPKLSIKHSAQLPPSPVPLSVNDALPLVEQHHDFLSRILNDTVHLDVVLVVTKGIFELLADAFDAVESEGYDGDDGDAIPGVVVYDGEGKEEDVKSQDLLLMDAVKLC